MSVTIEKTPPFIQWVGGKRKIVDKLIKYIPSGVNNYGFVASINHTSSHGFY